MWIAKSKALQGKSKSDGSFLAATFMCLALVAVTFMLAGLPAPIRHLQEPPDSIEALVSVYSMPVTIVAAVEGGTTTDEQRWSKNAMFVRPGQSVRTSTAEYALQLKCLAEAVYYEARGEKRSGRLAVAEVVINRVSNSRYPDTVCGVVYQGALNGGSKGCQFSFTCDGSLDRTREQGRAWSQSQELARYAMLGFGRDLTRDATHYHADYVAPGWASRLVRTVQIGRHIFYKRAG